MGKHAIPGIVFMRGGAVSILPVLECGDERFVLLVRQPRLAVGFAAFPEIPAGMLDGSGKFSGVAAKELQEETGIEISEDAVSVSSLLLRACVLHTRAWSSPSPVTRIQNATWVSGR